MGTPAISVLPAHIFILHFEPRLMSVLHGIPTNQQLRRTVLEVIRFDFTKPPPHPMREFPQSSSSRVSNIRPMRDSNSPAGFYPSGRFFRCCSEEYRTARLQLADRRLPCCFKPIRNYVDRWLTGLGEGIHQESLS